MPRRRSVLLLSLSVMWLALFFGLYVFFVHTSAGRGLDARIFNAVPRHHTIWFRLSGAVLGSEVVWVPVAAAAAAVLGWRARRLHQLVAGLATAAASIAMGELLKRALLSRPSAAATGAISNSFPSGHVVAATAAVVAVWFVVSDRRRPEVAVAGGLLCLLGGVATMVQQWHRPSDVVSAYALVAACACASAAFLSHRTRPTLATTPKSR